MVKYQSFGVEKVIGSVLIGKAIENLVFHGKYDVDFYGIEAGVRWFLGWDIGSAIQYFWVVTVIFAVVASLNFLELASLKYTSLDEYYVYRPLIIGTLVFACAASMYATHIVYRFTSIESAFCVLSGYIIIVYDIWRTAKRPYMESRKIGVMSNGVGQVAITIRGERSVVRFVQWDARITRIALAFANGKFEPVDDDVLPSQIDPFNTQTEALIVHLDGNGHMMKEYVAPIVHGAW